MWEPCRAASRIHGKTEIAQWPWGMFVTTLKALLLLVFDAQKKMKITSETSIYLGTCNWKQQKHWELFGFLVKKDPPRTAWTVLLAFFLYNLHNRWSPSPSLGELPRACAYLDQLQGYTLLSKGMKWLWDVWGLCWCHFWTPLCVVRARTVPPSPPEADPPRRVPPVCLYFLKLQFQCYHFISLSHMITSFGQFSLPLVHFAKCHVDFTGGHGEAT